MVRVSLSKASICTKLIIRLKLLRPCFVTLPPSSTHKRTDMLVEYVCVLLFLGLSNYGSAAVVVIFA